MHSCQTLTFTLNAAFCLSLLLLTTTTAVADEPFRPEPGKFPPADKAKSYTGELTFVDHANRRGSLRIRGKAAFYEQAATPFAMLPYGMVRYQGAPADLRDIPLGTILHGRFYLPPEPELSSVPTLRSGGGFGGFQVHFAENHAALLEDEPSFCLRQGLAWKLQEVVRKLEHNTDLWLVTARREPKGIQGQMSPVETNLKHGIGNIGQHHTAIQGTILDVRRLDGELPAGSSGVQIRVKVGMVLEGFRAGRMIRIRPMSWPESPVPREEYIEGIEERFPSPDIFKK